MYFYLLKNSFRYPLVIQESSGYLAIFDVTKRESFAYVVEILEHISMVLDEEIKNIPVILVGNKSDLDEQRKVSKTEADELAKKEEMVYIETSAKTGENVEKALNELVKQVWYKCDRDFSANIDFWSEKVHGHLKNEFREKIFLLLLVIKRNTTTKKELKVPKPLVRQMIQIVFESEFK